jgi:hypothetical protein
MDVSMVPVASLRISGEEAVTLGNRAMAKKVTGAYGDMVQSASTNSST